MHRWSRKKNACVAIKEETESECGIQEHYDSDMQVCVQSSCAVNQSWSDKSQACVEQQTSCPSNYTLTNLDTFSWGPPQYYDYSRLGDWKSQESFCECPRGKYWNDWGMYCQELEIPDCSEGLEWDQILRICSAIH